jgi:hypothetical protein
MADDYTALADPAPPAGEVEVAARGLVGHAGWWDVA